MQVEKWCIKTFNRDLLDEKKFIFSKHIPDFRMIQIDVQTGNEIRHLDLSSFEELAIILDMMQIDMPDNLQKNFSIRPFNHYVVEK